MEANELYRDIAARTGGDVYIGVVGPVRCGKSTFIKKFMEEAVLPCIKGEYDRKRTADELPQSAGGKTVMTTEPKFIPDEAVEISFGSGGAVRMRMIDCVGYMIPEALGGEEEGSIRMVNTPWSDEQLPFEEAAETGTRKVVRDHSTVGMLVTTDGSFGDIPRQSYTEAEERIAAELKSAGKPFAVILNSATPDSAESEALAVELEEKYNAPVALVNCLQLDLEDIGHILEMLLYEFPLREITVRLPSWMTALDSSHRLMGAVTEAVSGLAGAAKTLSDSAAFTDALSKRVAEAVSEMYKDAEANAEPEKTDMGTGEVVVALRLPESVYYKVICEMTGLEVESQSELISVLRELSAAKRELDRYSDAIDQLDDIGYGIVLPDIEEMKLEEPQIIRQSGSYGVKLRASATSVHMIRATIQTEINPIVGTEEQSEELVHYIMDEFEDDPKRIWESNIFGKSLYELLNDGLHTKLSHLSEQSKEKLSETLSRVINEGSGGLICIIL